jgi:peptide/nickel transport system permease protein
MEEPRESAPQEAQIAERRQTLSPKGARWPRLRLLVRSPIPLAASLILTLFILLAIFVAPSLYDIANRQNLNFRFFKPFQTSAGLWYFLGGDSLGRPLLAELVFASRASFAVAGSAVLIAAIAGMSIGLYSGYKGGTVDAVLMRIADIIVTLPSLLLALAVLFVVGASAGNLVVVLAIARLPVFLRTSRAQTLSIRESTFIEVSRSIGAKQARIIWQDIRPLVTPTILTVAMLELGSVMLAVSGLSFLGVGMQRPQIDWGSMVAEGRQFMTRAWWVTVCPGLTILLAALSANILSNWLRAIADPLQSSVLYSVLGRRRKGQS